MPPTLIGNWFTLALVLVAIWAMGIVSSLTMGGYLHVFLILAVGMMLPRFIWGRKAAR